MARSEINNGEIRQLARYQVRPESVEQCLAAIHEFVAYVRRMSQGHSVMKFGRSVTIRLASSTSSSSAMPR
jgi:hypothetical protein